MTRFARKIIAGMYLRILQWITGVTDLPAKERANYINGLAERSLSRFEVARAFFLSKDFPGLKYALHEVFFESEEIYPTTDFSQYVIANPFTEVQLNELVNPRKWIDPEWYSALRDLQVIPAHLELMHRKGYEWTQTVYGLRILGRLSPAARCLDVGAGHEVLAYWLANHVQEVIATDLYESDWAQGGAKEGAADVLDDPDRYAPFPYRKDNLVFKRMDGRKLDFDSNSFDFVVSLSSIEHFGGLQGATESMREMGRVCKPGGLLVVATELILNDAEHPEYFSLSELRELVSASGMRLIQEPVFRLPPAIRDNPTVLPQEHFRAPMLALEDNGVRFTSIMLFLEKPGA
jgi:SAM-dependent methyltransferase